jgi:hypothetical protein
MDTMEILKKYKYITYLIGAMEKPAEKDDGSSQREDIEAELLGRNVYPINPVKMEATKTGMNVDETKEKMKGWVAGGKWDFFTEKAKEIWLGYDGIDAKGGLFHSMGDIDYVKISTWITMNYKKGDHPCGTFAEAGVALEHRIPIYLITDFGKQELPKSLLQLILASGGEVFNSRGQYLKFLDETYKLKK